MDIEEGLQLAARVSSGRYSQDELDRFLWFLDNADAGQVSQVMEAYKHSLDQQDSYELMVHSDFIDRLKTLRPQSAIAVSDTHSLAGRLRTGWFRWAAAAAVLFFMAGGIYLITRRTTKQPRAAMTAYSDDVAPGGNKAILILSNGVRIVLDSASNGNLAVQGSSHIVKINSGLLAYKAQTEIPAVQVFNTLTTPRGGQYQLDLPDGTKVWLDAASSITFPTVFIGKERMVEITGQAYFAVARNSKMPFRVKAGMQVVEDLGTQFNINSYPDEGAIRTTVLEGSVRVSAYDHLQVLEPGDQAAVVAVKDNSILQSNSDPVGLLHRVNVDKVIAWKNGLFSFDHADIYTVMRQLSRWYDVDVQFEGKPSSVRFQGEIGRSLTLMQVLKGLEQIHVHFRLDEGKRIIILP